MPQLDILMFPAQSLFIFVYIIGYICFLKYILPILSFELKVKQLLELSYLSWFDKNSSKFIAPVNLVEFFFFYKLSNSLNVLNTLTTLKRVAYGFVYSYDSLYLRSKYMKRAFHKWF